MMTQANWKFKQLPKSYDGPTVPAFVLSFSVRDRNSGLQYFADYALGKLSVSDVRIFEGQLCFVRLSDARSVKALSRVAA